jgi:CheY-like chemotaxis protein
VTDEQTARTSPTVLIVDDEPDVIFLLRVNFEAAGFLVVEASHGAEALAHLKQSPADLVVTDLMMPIMDGRQLITRLRADPATAHIPIMVLSANPDGAPPVDATVRKPCPMAEIIRTAYALLKVA